MKNKYTSPSAELVLFAPLESVSSETEPNWFWGVYDTQNNTSVIGTKEFIWKNLLDTSQTDDGYKLND